MTLYSCCLSSVYYAFVFLCRDQLDAAIIAHVHDYVRTDLRLDVVAPIRQSVYHSVWYAIEDLNTDIIKSYDT